MLLAHTHLVQLTPSNLHFSFGSPWPLLLPNMADKEQFHSQPVSFEVELLQLYVGVVGFIKVDDGFFQSLTWMNKLA